MDGRKLRGRSGNPVEFSIITNAGNKARERMASMIQQDLAAIGIQVNIVTLDFPSLLDRIGKTMQYEACLLASQCRSGPRWTDEPVVEFIEQSRLESQADIAVHLLGSGDRSPDEGASFRVPSREAQGLVRRVQEIVVEQAPVLYLVNRMRSWPCHPAGQCAAFGAVSPRDVEHRRNLSHSEQMTAPLLTAQISVDYPGKPSVIDNVSICVSEGEVFGLAGRAVRQEHHRAGDSAPARMARWPRCGAKSTSTAGT